MHRRGGSPALLVQSSQTRSRTCSAFDPGMELGSVQLRQPRVQTLRRKGQGEMRTTCLLRYGQMGLKRPCAPEKRRDHVFEQLPWAVSGLSRNLLHVKADGSGGRHSEIIVD